MALFPGLRRWAGTRKVKPIWILLKQETVSGSGISWGICKSAPRSRQITTLAPHHSVFYRPDALPAAQPTAPKQWGLHQTKFKLYDLESSITNLDNLCKRQQKNCFNFTTANCSSAKWWDFNTVTVTAVFVSCPLWMTEGTSQNNHLLVFHSTFIIFCCLFLRFLWHLPIFHWA